MAMTLISLEKFDILFMRRNQIFLHEGVHLTLVKMHALFSVPLCGTGLRRSKRSCAFFGA